MAIGIYVLKNRISGKKYVGQSTNLIARLTAHKNGLDRQRIGKIIQKYGWDQFEKHLFYVPSDMLDYFEMGLIKKLGTMVPNGYNVNEGGNNWMRGKGNPMYGRRGSLNPFYGKHHSPETIERLRVGRPNSGRRPGYKHSPETIQKLREGQRRRFAALRSGKVA